MMEIVRITAFSIVIGDGVLFSASDKEAYNNYNLFHLDWSRQVVDYYPKY